MKIYRVIQTLLFILIISGCASDSESNPPLEANLILRDTFTQESNSFIQGENIEFFLTITNTKNEPVTLTFASSQQYDFYILSASGVEVWRWSSNKIFTTVVTQLVIPAQDRVEASETWDQIILAGGSIPIGNYTAFGSFLDQSSTAQFSFTIQ